jgi:hypothetical protein
MQLHGFFQDLQQGDASVAMHMQQAKSLFDELVVAERPISLEYFNLYVFRGLRGEFQDLVTNLATKTEPLSYFIVISLPMSFFTRPPFNPWLSTHLCCLHYLYYLQPILSSIKQP